MDTNYYDIQVGNQTDFIARKISIYNPNIVQGMKEMSEIGIDFLVLNHQYRYVFYSLKFSQN